MVETNKQTKQQAQEGIIVSDPDGVVIAWRDGLAHRFSWDQLRQLSMRETRSGQSAQPDVALVQQAA
jgi:ABC-type hemin transport system substrate-binding protein